MSDPDLILREPLPPMTIEQERDLWRDRAIRAAEHAEALDKVLHEAMWRMEADVRDHCRAPEDRLWCENCDQRGWFGDPGWQNAADWRGSGRFDICPSCMAKGDESGPDA